MAGMLEGKVALVTGGGSGIGRATAVAMAREGARVAVSDLSKEGIEATVAQINSAGGQSIAIAGDVTEESDVANMVARTVSAFGRIDCAYNNAGVAARSVGPAGQRIHELSQASVAKMFSVNLMGVFLCLKHEITQMLAQGSGGAIVNRPRSPVSSACRHQGITSRPNTASSASPRPRHWNMQRTASA